MNKTVGFQGEAGAFSESAAHAFFGDLPTLGFPSFDELIAAVDCKHVEFGLLPCENTIHGSIARSYDLLYSHPAVRIVGETTYRIVQSLVGTHDATLASVTHVRSHPIAIEQCRGFFERYPQIHDVVCQDTAGAIREIAQLGDPTQAAIGPASSAERHGARVLLDTISDVAENYTRFFALQRDGSAYANVGRACIAVSLPPDLGSLYRAYIEFDCASERDAYVLAGSLAGESRVLGWY